LPDLIISDWNMPGESGLDLLIHVRKNNATAKIPFILLTSDQDKSKIFKAKQYNPQFYLLKPCSKLFLGEKLAILAKTHGLKPPIFNSEAPPGAIPDSAEGLSEDLVGGENKPGKEILSASDNSTVEDVANVLKYCLFVLTKRKTTEEFRKFLSKEIFKMNLEDIKLQHIHELSGTLHTIIQQMLYSIFEEEKKSA